MRRQRIFDAMLTESAQELSRRLKRADARELAILEQALAGDDRKTVVLALKRARARIDAQEAEVSRINSLYETQRQAAKDTLPEFDGVIVGLDEVGRGSLAGPLAVGAVILPEEPRISGLNDSKRLTPEQRDSLFDDICSVALCWNVQYVEAGVIDDIGITASLKRAFSLAVCAVEEKGFRPTAILLDGNPLHLDPREVNVIKGDAKCASIAAASIMAKVSRDRLMQDYAQDYPQYGFESNKGYGTNLHKEAIREHGLCVLHRKSFCSEFLQESLF